MENNLFKQNFKNTRENREKILDQKGKVLFFTGLSGSGKSAIANAVQQLLYNDGFKTYILDGDNIRMGLNSNLSFEKKDREENIRRISEVSKLFADSGLIVLTSFISPYKETREKSREIIGDDYIEIYVDTNLETCIRRDIKGLYQKAIDGEIKDFTGINDNYDIPENPDIIVDGNKDGEENILDCAFQIYNKIK
jgi:adenylyl-sulfate kinase